MAIEPDFLRKLRCPRTHKPLRPLEAAERDALNASIGKGGVTTTGGRAVEAPLDDGLVPEGERFVYPVDGDIPILLVDEAIPFA